MWTPAERRIALFLACAITAGPLFAAEMIINAGADQENYQETRGAWQSVDLSQAPGIAQARRLTSETGSAMFSFTGVQPGDYTLQALWPDQGTMKPVDALIRSDSVTEVVQFSMDANQSNQWVTIKEISIPTAQDLRVVVQPASEAAGDLVLAGLKLTDSAAPADATPMDDPFEGTPSNTEVDNPFDEGVTEQDPFADEDPFEQSAPAAAADNPFDQGTAEEDPFAEPEDPIEESPFEESDSPFESSAAETTSPFDEEPAEESESPFMTGQGTRIEPAESDPFATEGGSPFEGTDSAAADPFAQDPAESIAVDDPFETGDPFATEAADPFETAAPSNPLTDGSAQDPFAVADEPAMNQTDDPFESALIVQSAMPDAPPAISPDPGPMEIPAQPTPEPETELVDLAYGDSLPSAVEQAKRNGRNVFLLFSGKTTSSRRFEETLRNPEVAEMLMDFELVRLDYRDNRTIASRFTVSRFPYIVIVNQHGYTEGHIVPTNDIEELVEEISPFVATYF